MILDELVMGTWRRGWAAARTDLDWKGQPRENRFLATRTCPRYHVGVLGCICRCSRGSQGVASQGSSLEIVWVAMALGLPDRGSRG